jgi:hypothetical protein
MRHSASPTPDGRHQFGFPSDQPRNPDVRWSPGVGPSPEDGKEGGVGLNLKDPSLRLRGRVRGFSRTGFPRDEARSARREIESARQRAGGWRWRRR